MGNQHNVQSHHFDVKITNKELEKYEKETHCNTFYQSNTTDNKNEIKQLHKQFHDEVSSGYILQKDFHILTDMMGIKNEVVSNILFQAFDSDNDNRISFHEFILAMSVMKKGTPDEKLRCMTSSIYV
jgi:Ca2+-binding EF-hand superfamily protein